MTIPIEIARRALEEVKDVYRQHKDVNAIGIGEQHTNGKPTGKLAIIFLVEKKTKQIRSLIPANYQYGTYIIPTDVQITSQADFEVKNNHLDGSDMLVASRVHRFGTLGIVVREAGGSGRVFGITNAHVVSRPNENHVGDPIEAIVNGNRFAIGHVAYQAPYFEGRKNNLDLALVALNSTGINLAETYKIQTFPSMVVGSGQLSASKFGGALKEHSYGGSSQNSRDIVHCGALSEHSEVIIRDGSTRMHFGKTFIFSSVSQNIKDGHSGSILVRQGSSGLIAAGILAAGVSSAFVFSFSDILSELRRAGIELL